MRLDRVADPERDRTRPRQPRIASQDAARPPQGERHDRRAGARRGHEGAEPERPEPGRRHEGAFRKEQDAAPGGERAGDLVGVGDALEHVPAVDGGVAAAPHERADHGVGQDLALGDEQHVDRQQREQRGDVHVRGVIAGQHERAAPRQPLEPGRLEAAAHEAQQGACRQAREREGEAPARHEHGERPRRKQERRQQKGEPGRVEPAADPARERPRPFRGRGACKPQLLREGRALRFAERPGEELLASGGAPHLAARGLEHRAGSHQHDLVGRHFDRRGHALGDGVREPRALDGVPGARLRDHHQRLGAERLVRHAEGHDAAAAHALDRGRRLLDLLRHQVAAGLDDQVLAASADVDLAVRAVREVAAVEPPAGQRDGGGRLRLAVVAGGHRGAAEDETAHAHDPRGPAPRRPRRGSRARAAPVPRRRTRARPCPRCRPRRRVRRAGRRCGSRGRSAARGRAAERRGPRSTRRGRRPASSPRARSRSGRSGGRSARASRGSPARRRSARRATTTGRGLRARRP